MMREYNKEQVGENRSKKLDEKSDVNPDVTLDVNRERMDFAVETVLVTGGTGFLGTEIISRLIRLSAKKIYVLVRAESWEAAGQRLRSMWYHDKELYRAVGERVIPLLGDLTLPGLGLNPEESEHLEEEASVVIHAGALIGFQIDENELMQVNVEGTAHAIDLAKGLHRLKRFVHISTAYVAGQRGGRILEADPPAETFSSLYEETKAQVESLVTQSGLPYIICRPGMIVGNSRTGYIRSFNTIYYMLKLFLTGKMKMIPVNKEIRLNLVPVDYVAETVIEAAGQPGGAGRIFHVTCPPHLQPQVGELVDYVARWAYRNLNIKLARPVYAPFPGLKKAGLVYNQKKEGRRKSFLTNLLTLSPYFYGDQIFDRTNTDSLATAPCPFWKDYMDPLLDFACRNNFMEQKGMTVFEQACLRRASKRYPIRYFDVGEEGMVEMSGPEANERIEKILDALWSHGIRPGDRVGLTGINSAAYMLLDQALGLLGAVTVPIYYTAPIDEAKELLEKSGAKWFFVGDRRIMSQMDSDHSLGRDIRLVAFSDGINVSKPGVVHWEQFLYETNAKAPKIHPDSEDLATIRYTSGTTGDPKGVCFHFAQLAWMGQVLSNLLNFRERNQSMRYLSFLPLSHVVEGILASYAPYYVLAQVEYYFLNDFGKLTEALPKVRPNVFFSVPRFYEKLWDQILENKLGKAWLAMEDGPGKKAVGRVLKKAVLKKAGLDACHQLIVGSAPVSSQLLRNFRELGIEIHNAYGQAEAPLITINRLGHNIISTVGTPLPETRVSLAEDGELIVEGPQVCQGYYGMESENIRNGILRTGDLGKIDPNGNVTLYGRKKEMIITAYGKNISIPKIEERLKDIPAVSEAVLIGEKRPYCTALLWLEHSNPDLEKEIEKMNRDLSHPEQIRKYRVIKNPLTIEAGELTPNLKVRRARVEERYRRQIEEMYR